MENIIKENTQTEMEQKEINLEAWDTLTEDQQLQLKESLLKSKYGIGGEHFSTFPTLLDNKINPWVEQKYQISKLPKRVSEKTFKDWEINGEIKIIPLLKGEKIHYLITILPNKNIKMELWELEKEGIKPYLKYTTHNSLGEITLTKNHFHILNGYTNKNKAFNQSKQLVKLFQLGTDFKTLEGQKELKTNYLQLDITDGHYILKEIKATDHKPNGKTYKDLGDYLGRKQHQKINFNYMENIG